MRDSLNNYLELSLDYAQAGLNEEADQVLAAYKGSVSPLINYYRGWFASQQGKEKEAMSFYSAAAKEDPTSCFPNKIEEILILQDARRLNPRDARVGYYLGNLWYDKRQYSDAIACWEAASALDNKFPTVFRNLALAWYNKLGKKELALNALEKAFALDPSDARILMELDQLYKIMGRPFVQRLELLEKYAGLTEQRDDLYLERVTLYNQLKQYEKAGQLLATRKFHPWEGGEGKVVGQWLLCHIELAKAAIRAGEWQKALELLTVTATWPENLGEGKLYGTQENDLHYLLGCVYEGLGQTATAQEKFKAATVGISQPVQAIYYNDPQPDKIIYQALAWRKLGEPEKARRIFESFIAFGELHRSDTITIDYFAVSLPDMLVFDQDIDLRNRIHCLYLIGLGHLGLGDPVTATRYLQEVLQLDRNHQGAAVYLEMKPFFPSAKKQDQLC
jgi:tetratricopeptide (TPR) repeat protein